VVRSLLNLDEEVDPSWPSSRSDREQESAAHDDDEHGVQPNCIQLRAREIALQQGTLHGDWPNRPSLVIGHGRRWTSYHAANITCEVQSGLPTPQP